MPDSITANLAGALAAREFPTITFWNRLEGRPRADAFERALRAEVRDALWMLTRQWQMGEFRGDDAGSPITAKVHLSATRLRKYQAYGGPVEPFDDDVPLEAEVERRPVQLVQGGREVSLDLRLLMGRHWLKMVKQAIGDFSAQFIAAYPIHAPDPTDTRDAVYCAHPEAWSGFAAAARRMDGGKLYLHLKADPTNHAWDGIAALGSHKTAVDALAARFVAWFERLIHQPASGSAWVPDRLEYQFACSAPDVEGEKILAADEYYHGHLDWYSLDVDDGNPLLGDTVPGDALPGDVASGDAVPGDAAPGDIASGDGAFGGPDLPTPDTQILLPKPDTQVLLPTPVSFDGMPNTRWWTFEDGRTNFGDIKPDTTDLAKLLLIEFGLVYANDWFLIPYTVPAGSMAQVRGLAVTNVFGERTWVEAAGRGPDDDWQRWAMFLLNVKGTGGQAADTSLLLPPAATTILEGQPVEEAMLVRDEVANMVWGVERTIRLPTGEAKPGREAARESRLFYEQDLERRLGSPPAPPPVAESARVRYEVMTSVPEHWIPFIPVHVEGDVREIQLQRGAMPRILEGDPQKPGKVRPRTAPLREGLETTPRTAYFLHEEEVPRAGVRVTQSFRRTRWRDGRAWVWLGVRKGTGRGEGSSGLAFDILRDV